MSWEALRSGKVRDVFVNKEKRLIALVASDRVSAFDKILPGNGIPGKGACLTAVSNYWAIATAKIPNAYIWDLDIIEEFCKDTGVDKDRVTIQRLTKPLPVEAIVRGYITGSAWRAYEKGVRSICGLIIPDGLVLSEKFQTPLFTPTTKAEHDENISYEQMVEILVNAGYRPEIAEYVRETSLSLYNEIYCAAKEKGLIFVDTKFEFGYDEITGQVYVIDEIGTSDSSRYWALEGYEAGKPQEDYDKEVIRQYILEQRKKGIEDPPIPEMLVQQATERYEALKKILLGAA